MKLATLLPLPICFFAVTAQANTVGAPKLEAACQNKILAAAHAECEKDSASDASREHGCWLNGIEVNSNGADTASVAISFTVTDAVHYDYAAAISDQSTCTFKISSQN